MSRSMSRKHEQEQGQGQAGIGMPALPPGPTTRRDFLVLPLDSLGELVILPLERHRERDACLKNKRMIWFRALWTC